MAADPASYPRLGKASQGKMKSTCSREVERFLACNVCHVPMQFMNLQNGSTKTSKGKRQQKVPLKQLHLRTERGRAWGGGACLVS